MASERQAARPAEAASAQSAVATPETAQWIETPRELEAACEYWLGEPALGLDTEFVRERTFYPALGLIQVADSRGCFLLDPISLPHLEPLRAVLQAPSVVKVFHSCGEDLEVLYHLFETFPEPLFDTQIAASLSGVGHSLGYSRLVEVLFGVEIPKGETRTDWLRRPLTEAQKTYATLDVAYLLPAYRELRARLGAAGREEWAREEVSRLADAERFLPDPDRAYSRLRGARALRRRELAHLQALCAWREREARKRDLPRSFVLRDSALLRLAQRPTTSLKRLQALPELRRAEIRRYGTRLQGIARQVAELRPEELPAPAGPGADLSAYRREVDRLRLEVRRTAEELGIAPELLATRRAVESIVRRFVSGKVPTMPPELEGWRRTVLEERLLGLLRPESAQRRPPSRQ